MLFSGSKNIRSKRLTHQQLQQRKHTSRTSGMATDWPRHSRTKGSKLHDRKSKNNESIWVHMKENMSRLHRKERFLDRKLKDEENCFRSLPHGIIFGVMKCGTETLSTFLSIHPNVSMQFKVRAVMFFYQVLL